MPNLPLAGLATLCLVAVAAPIATAQPACTPGKDIAFQIDHRSTVAASPMASKFVLYDNGAWSFDEHSGTRTRTGAGCIASARVEALAKLFTAASWKVTTEPATCTLDPGLAVDYHFRGKLVAAWAGCDGKRFDPSATQALSQLTTLANPLIASTTPPSSKK